MKKKGLDSTLSLKMYCLVHLQGNVLDSKGKRLFKNYVTNNRIHKTIVLVVNVEYKNAVRKSKIYTTTKSMCCLRLAVAQGDEII